MNDLSPSAGPSIDALSRFFLSFLILALLMVPGSAQENSSKPPADEDESLSLTDDGKERSWKLEHLKGGGQWVLTFSRKGGKLIGTLEGASCEIKKTENSIKITRYHTLAELKQIRKPRVDPPVPKTSDLKELFQKKPYSYYTLKRSSGNLFRGTFHRLGVEWDPKGNITETYHQPTPVVMVEYCNPEPHRKKVQQLSEQILDLIYSRNTVSDIISQIREAQEEWGVIYEHEPISTEELISLKHQIESFWKSANNSYKKWKNYETMAGLKSRRVERRLTEIDLGTNEKTSARRFLNNAGSEGVVDRISTYLEQAKSSDLLSSIREDRKALNSFIKDKNHFPPLDSDQLSSSLDELRNRSIELVRLTGSENYFRERSGSSLAPDPPAPVERDLLVHIPGVPTFDSKKIRLTSGELVTPARYIRALIKPMLPEQSSYPLQMKGNGIRITREVKEAPLSRLRNIRSMILDSELNNLAGAIRKDQQSRKENFERQLRMIGATLAAVLEYRRISRYNGLVLNASRRSHPELIRLAGEVVNQLQGTVGKYETYRDQIVSRLEKTREKYRKAYEDYMSCLVNAKNQALEQEMKRLHNDLFPKKQNKLKKTKKNADRAIDDWWKRLDGRFKELTDRSEQYGDLLFQVYTLGLDTNDTALEALVQSADTFNEIVGIAQLAELLGKGGLKAADGLKNGLKKGFKKLMDKAGDLASVGKKSLTPSKKFVDDVLDTARRRGGKNGKLVGDEETMTRAVKKGYKHLKKETDLTDDEIQKVLQAAIDPAERNRVLGMLRDSLKSTADDLGDFDFNSVGTGAKLDRYLAGKDSKPPSPEDWNFFANDYDVSVYVPEKTVNNIVNNMSRKELNTYLKRYGYKPGGSLEDLPNPAAARKWIAERKIIDRINESFKTHKNNRYNLSPEAYDNMYFPGNPTKATREELIADAAEHLRHSAQQNEQVRSFLKKQFGNGNVYREFSKAVRRGNTSRITAALKEANLPDHTRKLIYNNLHQAGFTRSMEDVMSGKLPAWRVVDVIDNDPFIARGGKKMVDLMMAGTGNPKYRVAKKGFDVLDESAEMGRYAKTELHFTPADGHDIITEMSAVFHQKHKKSLDKVAKYYLRAAFGRLATNEKIAAQLVNRYKTLSGSPEARMVKLVEEMGQQKNMFNPEDVHSLKQALLLKYPHLAKSQDPEMMKFFKKVKKPEKSSWKQLRNQWTRKLRQWHDSATDVYNKRVQSGEITDMQDRLHRMGRNFTLSRLDADTLKNRFKISPERAKQIEALQKNKSLRSLTSGNLDPKYVKWQRNARRNIDPYRLQTARQFLKNTAGMIAPETTDTINYLMGNDPGTGWVNVRESDPKKLIKMMKRAAPSPSEKDVSFLGALGELMSNPEGNLASFYGSEDDLAVRLTRAATHGLLNPHGFLAGLTKSTARILDKYFGIFGLVEWAKHDKLFRKLTNKRYGIVRRLNYSNPSNPFRTSVESDYRDVKDAIRDVELSLAGLDVEMERFGQKLKKKLKEYSGGSDYEASQRSFLKTMINRHNKFVTSRVDPVENRMKEKVPFLKNRLALLEEAREAVRSKRNQMFKIRRAQERLGKTINNLMTYYDYESFIKLMPVAFRSVASMARWVRVVRYQVLDKTDVEELEEEKEKLKKRWRKTMNLLMPEGSTDDK